MVNRAYYVVFYTALALFLKEGITLTTSKHSGVIGLFDKHFILSGKIERKYSRIFHNLFDDRQEFDYKEFTEVTQADAQDAVDNTGEFLTLITRFLTRSIDSGKT